MLLFKVEMKSLVVPRLFVLCPAGGGHWGPHSLDPGLSAVRAPLSLAQAASETPDVSGGDAPRLGECLIVSSLEKSGCGGPATGAPALFLAQGRFPPATAFLRNKDKV